jgi:hypothetical protein
MSLCGIGRLLVLLQRFLAGFPKVRIEPRIDGYLHRMLVYLDFRMNRVCMTWVVAHLRLKHRKFFVKASSSAFFFRSIIPDAYDALARISHTG